ncbi:MAG: hypothetical protein V1873_06145 [Verrucomicrobiota bacterium]
MAGLVLAAALLGAFAFDAEYYEVDAGTGISVQANPEDNIYGLCVEDGTWLRDTPVFGKVFVTAFRNGPEDAWFGGIGMIFRLMPHGRLAPFVGVGASYNYPFGSGWHEDENEDEDENESEPESYWGGHAEAGLRWWFAEKTHFIELYGQQTWRLESGDGDYWVAGLAYGQNL